MHGPRGTVLLATILASLMAGASLAQEPDVRLTFELNDAFVKGKVLPGVEIEMSRTRGGAIGHAGVTGTDGRVAMDVAPGTWFVTYRLRGYVAILGSETLIRGDRQMLITSLSLNVESEGGGPRVRIVLNWGSRPDQMPDADAHALCPCEPTCPHVYFQVKAHDGADHEVTLDVDDRDGGGPETITLRNPVAGAYRYFVHNFSGGPRGLGSSEAVVRVFTGDEQIGEFRVPADAGQRVWRPFKHIEVSAAGVATIVPFGAEELQRIEDRQIPAGTSRFRELPDAESASQPADPGALANPGAREGRAFVVGSLILVVVLAALVGWFLRRK